ncbi:MAG: DUF4388 domain-containing protein [Nitrospirae bacterium]|nr:DUF4388 domain-containing protein [Nitrospirota bacterium]
MALEGSLSDFGLADILQLIYFQRKTGVLTLEGKTDKVRLLFIEGNISGAESKRRIDDNRLGKVLLKKGLIKEVDLQSALEEQRKTGMKLGNILIRKEQVGKDIVVEILSSQITETVIQIFGWKQGTYEFAAQGVPQDKDLPFSIDTQHLLMEGLRIVDEMSVIKDKITLDTVLHKKAGSPSGLTEEEEEILSYVDGENDVSTIIDLSGKDNFQVSKTLLSLMEKGIIEAFEAQAVITEDLTVETRKHLAIISYLPAVAIALSLILSLTVVLMHQGEVLKKFRAAGDIEELRLTLETFRMEHSAYPQSPDLITRKKDPWGRPYIYHLSENLFSITSAGADGKEGTGDDIY